LEKQLADVKKQKSKIKQTPYNLISIDFRLGSTTNKRKQERKLTKNVE
jgi:hypothetical protein